MCSFICVAQFLSGLYTVYYSNNRTLYFIVVWPFFCSFEDPLHIRLLKHHTGDQWDEVRQMGLRVLNKYSYGTVIRTLSYELIGWWEITQNKKKAKKYQETVWVSKRNCLDFQFWKYMDFMKVPFFVTWTWLSVYSIDLITQYSEISAIKCWYLVFLESCVSLNMICLNVVERDNFTASLKINLYGTWEDLNW